MWEGKNGEGKKIVIVLLLYYNVKLCGCQGKSPRIKSEFSTVFKY